MTILKFQNAAYSSENNVILDNLSLDIEKGDFISIVGPSGSGKSTFLKLCCHLISQTKGSILYKNKEIIEYNPVELRKKISYCFQTPYLFGDKVMDNLIFPYSIRNEKVDMERIKELFHMFNLDNDFIDKEIKNLSGGEKQRIALIRNLIFEPEVLLLDEVTASLDLDNTRIVENVIYSLNKRGITILWVTHSPEQSRKYANKILTIEAGKIKSLEVLE